jgi:dTMP kinase
LSVNRGPLIAFEGIDGCGKSTQIRRLATRLEAAGVCVVKTFEPTRGEWGQRIRAMARSGERVPAEDELAWFMADRAEHVAELVEPARARGDWVLTDRYYLSTVAYQGARGLDASAILAESERRFPAPDLCLLFEVPARIGLQRVQSRGGIAEPVFEELGFLERVEAAFEALDLPYLARIDAQRDEAEIEADVLRIVGARFDVDLSA